MIKRDNNTNFSDTTFIKRIKINDNEVKNLISRYKDGETELSAVIDYLAGIIYSFPKYFSNFNEDSCSDFFEYVLVRFEKIISGYKIMDFQFSTWFYLVLRRHYYNWVKSEADKSYKNRRISILSLNDDYTAAIADTVAYYNIEHHSNDKRIIDALEKLPPEIRVVIKLHFLDFFKEKDFFDIKDAYGGELTELVSKYYSILENALIRKQEVVNIQERISKTFNKMLSLQQSVETENNNSTKSLLDELEIEKSKLNENREKFKKTYTSLKNIEIASLLGIPSRQVSNLLYKGKNLLRKILRDYRFFFICALFCRFFIY